MFALEKFYVHCNDKYLKWNNKSVIFDQDHYLKLLHINGNNLLFPTQSLWINFKWRFTHNVLFAIGPLNENWSTTVNFHLQD